MGANHIHQHPAVCKPAGDNDPVNLAANNACKVRNALRVAACHCIVNKACMFIARFDHALNLDCIACSEKSRQAGLSAYIAAHLSLCIFTAVAKHCKLHRLNFAAAFGCKPGIVIAVAIDAASVMNEPCGAAAADMVNNYRAVFEFFAENLFGAFSRHCAAVEHMPAACL